ncbi:zinc finger protein rotund [Anopheles stephensi]|uniref:zinc finger protein rotund n=1 Tax=Anopheles stephensi TaxID=30069 RepID=UPI0007D0FCD9|nr:zinc finger protein rotund [Anopheles stephensi]XP_035892716.1 zinc finger protein rotund [Anopheles stephensi]XP_035892717.1 zinc finger protein rotund [Anopheles stephensi]XP_035892718.1 zinc finger protein rotund [Anopheles stephensi]XP_035892719.1 zinc finger protein rotund [Anopheles stephensi]XP_035892720.1 zinc finger protein rotund [Anopheles stephensi]XP_035892721.1 zinc finger protein rotund [Anopheles stephensi]XP_035892722.1 zinc finger protein rotund [Anopheles stephensi]XP_
MNFSPFGTHFPGTIPGIHQFASSGLVTSVPTTSHDSTNRYHSINSNVNMAHFNQSHAPILGKFHRDSQESGGNAGGGAGSNKYNGHAAAGSGNSTIPTTTTSGGAGAGQYTNPYSQHSHVAEHKQRNMYHQPSVGNSSSTGASNGQSAQELSQDISALLQQADSKRVLQNPSWQSLTPGASVADYLSHLPGSALPLSLHHFLKYSAENIKKEAQNPLTSLDMSQAQSQSHSTGGGGGGGHGSNNGAGMVLPASQTIASILGHPGQQQQQQHGQQQSAGLGGHQAGGVQAAAATSSTGGAANAASAGSGADASTDKKKRKKKKKPPKERKPRPKPGEIQVRTALDGSLLFLCPECQMAYPERELLEQHLIGHNLERRFICDICNAALKRKDHLTRHKQSHNPERPFACTICLKAFKRKEQLTLHFVIHSGEKRHVCQECGKGFYRKDHLRKHTRSHIARRLKAELSQQQGGNGTDAGASPSTSRAGQIQAQISAAAQQQQQQQQQSAQQQSPMQQPQLAGSNQQLQPPQYHSLTPGQSQMMS